MVVRWVGFPHFIFNLTTQTVLATPIKTNKELTFKMTTVQMAAWKSSEPFNLPEDLSLQQPKSFMWVPATILATHTHKRNLEFMDMTQHWERGFV